MSDVTLTEIPIDTAMGGSFHATGVLGVPAGDGPWPGVVMVHEAYGITEVMRRQVERMAEAGYLVLMPDLYADGGARRCMFTTFRAFAAGEGKPFVDIEGARAQLVADSRCTGAVGVLGFCMGGGFALVAATRGFDAASVNYGLLPDPLDPLFERSCPVVASYGGRDRMLRGAAATLEAGYTRAGIAHDVREYPDAGHQFLNDAPSGPVPMRWLMERMIGAKPDPVAAADAWTRIEAFFGEHLAR